IWEGTSGQLRCAALRDAPAAGVSGGVFDTFINNAFICDSGRVVFAANMKQGPGGVTVANSTGLRVSDSDGTTRLLARNGDTIPAIGGGATWYNILTSEFATNASGQVAFTAYYNIGGNLRFGLFGADPSGNIIPLVLQGQLFDVDPTPGVDLRTVSQVATAGAVGNGQDGRPTFLDAAGDVGFYASFTDGS